MSEAAGVKAGAKETEIGFWRRYAQMPPLLRALRPIQWSKNSLVFAALLFDRQVFDFDRLWRCLGAALVFCAVSSAIYLINDVRDREQDRLHPRKRFRPIAAGQVTVAQATRVAVLLLLAAVFISIAVQPAFVLVVLGYIALMVGYSFGLKRLVIVDVFAIASGFVLRAAGGAVAIAVTASPWLFVCTALGALFIGFGKRRNELITLDASAGAHRANLDDYSLPMLDQIIAIVSASMLVSYAFYTFEASTVPDSHAMMLTIPFVAYGLFRYLFLMYRRGEGGSPELLLVRDPGLITCIVGWVATSLAILYFA